MAEKYWVVLEGEKHGTVASRVSTEANYHISTLSHEQLFAIRSSLYACLVNQTAALADNFAADGHAFQQGVRRGIEIALREVSRVAAVSRNEKPETEREE